ncbi:MAG: hypothetical protein C0433_06920 [Cyclobacterium sp.]|nr:hypothetical protein [Cyclobacterium sp.]
MDKIGVFSLFLKNGAEAWEGPQFPSRFPLTWELNLPNKPNTRKITGIRTGLIFAWLIFFNE